MNDYVNKLYVNFSRAKSDTKNTPVSHSQPAMAYVVSCLTAPSLTILKMN